MPEKTIKCRLADTRDPELADDDGAIFSTVAKLVDALQRGVNFDFLSVAEEFGAAVSFANRTSPQPYEANKSIVMLKAAIGKGPV